MNKIELSPEAREAQRAYNRKYYAANREKRRESKRLYWERKAARADSEEKKAVKSTNDE